MTEKQYRLNKWGTRLLKNNRPLFDWFNDSDEIVDLLNELDEKWIDEYALRETLQQELQRVEEENKQLRQQINELQFNKAKGQQEYQRRVFYE